MGKHMKSSCDIARSLLLSWLKMPRGEQNTRRGSVAPLDKDAVFSELKTLYEPCSEDVRLGLVDPGST